MCCGARRSSLAPIPPRPRSAPPAPRPPADPRADPAAAASGTPAGLAALRYTQDAAIRVVGPATGRAYAFSGERPLQMVDPRDAERLARSTLFRRA